MNEIYEQLNYSLSDEDLHALLPNVRQIEYADLRKYRSIRQLLPKERDAVILFVAREDNVGHWQAIIRVGNDIIFFDSYGHRPDKALLWAPVHLRRHLGQKFPALSLLLNKALEEGFIVHFNSYPYQNEADPNIATCGRWCILAISYFLKNTNPSLTGFHEWVMNACKKYEVTPDILVCMLIR